MSEPRDPLSWLDGERATSEQAALLTRDAGRLSYAELSRRVCSLALTLQREGLGPGTPLAFPATSTSSTFLLIHTAIQLGVPLVPLHSRLTPTEVQQVVALARPRRIVTLEEVDALAEAASAGRGARDWRPCPLDPESPLAIVTTSGTTGRPKGAVLSRRAFVASARASAANLPLGPGDRWVACMPLGHVGGLSVLTRCLLAGATVCLSPRFEPLELLERLGQLPGALLSLVPTMLEALFEAEERGASLEPLRGLRALLLGGAAASPRLLARARRRELPLLTTYGLTEACSQVSTQSPERSNPPTGGCGQPLQGLSVRVVDEEGQELPRGQRGRIRVGGPTLLSGYLVAEREGLQAPVLDQQGTFDTGDLGYLDAEGALHVEGRRADLIVTGGENVSPAEVEVLLQELPGVGAALAFGVPDARWGQVVAAAVVRGPGYDPLRVIDACRARLASHKRPRLLAEVLALPLTPAGKPDRLGAAERLRELLRIVG